MASKEESWDWVTFGLIYVSESTLISRYHLVAHYKIHTNVNT